MKPKQICSLIVLLAICISVRAQLTTAMADSAMMRSPDWSYEFRKASGSSVYGFHFLSPHAADSGIFLVDYNPDYRLIADRASFSVVYIPNGKTNSSWRSDSIVSVFHSGKENKLSFLDNRSRLHFENGSKIQNLDCSPKTRSVSFSGEKIYLLEFDSALRKNTIRIRNLATIQEVSKAVVVPFSFPADLLPIDSMHLLITTGSAFSVFDLSTNQISFSGGDKKLNVLVSEKSCWISSVNSGFYDSLFIHQVKHGKTETISLQHQFTGSNRDYLLLDSSVIIREITFHNGIADSCFIRSFNRKNGKQNWWLYFNDFKKLSKNDDLNSESADLFETFYFIPVYGDESTFCLVEYDNIVKFNSTTGEVINHIPVFEHKTRGEFFYVGEIQGLLFFFKTERQKNRKGMISEHSILFVVDPVRNRYRDAGNDGDSNDQYYCIGKNIFRVRKSIASFEIDRFSPAD